MLPSTVFDRWQGFHGRTLVLTMTTDEYTWIRNRERQMQPRLHAPFSSVHFDLFQQFPMECLKLSSQHSINRWPPFTQEVIYIFCEHLKQRIFLSCRINAILVSSNLRYEDVKSTSSLFCTQLSCEGDTTVSVGQKIRCTPCTPAEKYSTRCHQFYHRSWKYCCITTAV